MHLLIISWSRLAVFQGFRFKQEPIFSYRARALTEDPGSGFWVLVMTERVNRVCATTFVAAYEEYRLWYIPLDIIAFARELGMAIADPLGSRANIREVLEMLEIIDVTRFELLPTSWRSLSGRVMDYHIHRNDVCGDFFYHDPFMRHKID